MSKISVEGILTHFLSGSRGDLTRLIMDNQKEQALEKLDELKRYENIIMDFLAHTEWLSEAQRTLDERFPEGGLPKDVIPVVTEFHERKHEEFMKEVDEHLREHRERHK